MSDTWSKWSVYEYMRHSFMRAGWQPDLQELQENFPDVPMTEIMEGVQEFELTIGGGQVAK